MTRDVTSARPGSTLAGVSALRPEDRARIEQTVGAFPDGDWWKQTNEAEFVGLAVELVGLGVPVDKALSVLERAYWAAATEFGA